MKLKNIDFLTMAIGVISFFILILVCSTLYAENQKEKAFVFVVNAMQKPYYESLKIFLENTQELTELGNIQSIDDKNINLKIISDKGLVCNAMFDHLEKHPGMIETMNISVNNVTINNYSDIKTFYCGSVMKIFELNISKKEV